MACLATLVALPAAQGEHLGLARAQADPAAWLYDPLQVNEIDLEASDAALDSLRDSPRAYVDAQITLHDGSTAYGPFAVGLRLKGQSSFRDLDAKAAFRIKFGYAVPHQEVMGLNGLTLNNMVQDPSMIAEAASSIALRAAGLPAARVGYAWVRLNGEDYGLYADVETIDKAMAKRWLPDVQHVYEASYRADVVPGGADAFDVAVGSSRDMSDLDALIAAASSGPDGWSDRMKPVADLAEMARAFAAEHYIGQFDGYSYGSTQGQPNNYDLVSDDGGRFSILLTGLDQTWEDGPNFGLTGNGVLLRECLVSTACQTLYMSALRDLASNRELAALAATARSIRDAVAPWRARDPRREQPVAVGEAQADAKIALMAARPDELATWLGAASTTGGATLATGSSARPLFGSAVRSPASPVAGKTFTFTLRVTRSDTGAPLAAGRLTSAVSVERTRIRTRSSFAHGRVRLSLTVPGTAAGKRLTVKIELTASHETALGIYTYAVR